MINPYPTPWHLAQADRQRWFPRVATTPGNRDPLLDLLRGDYESPAASNAASAAPQPRVFRGAAPVTSTSGESALAAPDIAYRAAGPQRSPASIDIAYPDLPPGIGPLVTPEGAPVEGSSSAAGTAANGFDDAPGPVHPELLEASRRSGRTVEELQSMYRAAMAYKAAKTASIEAAKRGRMIPADTPNGAPPTGGPVNIATKPQLGVVVSSLLQFEESMLRRMAHEINEQCQQQIRSRVLGPMAHYEAQQRVLYDPHG